MSDLNKSAAHNCDTKSSVIIATLGPEGTCSEFAANYYATVINKKASNILCNTFEEAIKQLVEGYADLVIIPSAYRNLANLIFDLYDKIEISDVFKLCTPNLVTAILDEPGGCTELRKIATHASPFSLAKNFYPEAELILSGSNSLSARMLYEREVDACITTNICAQQYKFMIIKDFGEISMGWNVFKKKNY